MNYISEQSIKMSTTGTKLNGVMYKSEINNQIDVNGTQTLKETELTNANSKNYDGKFQKTL